MNRGAIEVHRGLKRCGIGLITSVPCINLSDLICLIDSDPDMKHVPVSREEEGIGICAGAYLGGMNSAIVMQNSGLGNSINALASLDLLYGVPLLMIISHRGVDGEPIEAQVPMGQLTEPLLRTMGIPFYHPEGGRAEEDIVAGWGQARQERRPVAILLSIPFWR